MLLNITILKKTYKLFKLISKLRSLKKIPQKHLKKSKFLLKLNLNLFE